MLTMTVKLFPSRGQTGRVALVEILRGMADGIEAGQTQGGTDKGGHWSVDLHGIDLDKEGSGK